MSPNIQRSTLVCNNRLCGNNTLVWNNGLCEVNEFNIVLPCSSSVYARKSIFWCSTFWQLHYVYVYWLNVTTSHYIAFIFHGCAYFFSINKVLLSTSTDKLYHTMLYRVHIAWSGFVINTDCIGSCKSNYHRITTKTASN